MNRKNSPTPPVRDHRFTVDTPAGVVTLIARDMYEAKTMAAALANCTYDETSVLTIDPVTA